jgi:hypothetical protein
MDMNKYILIILSIALLFWPALAIWGAIQANERTATLMAASFSLKGVLCISILYITQLIVNRYRKAEHLKERKIYFCARIAEKVLNKISTQSPNIKISSPLYQYTLTIHGLLIFLAIHTPLKLISPATIHELPSIIWAIAIFFVHLGGASINIIIIGASWVTVSFILQLFNRKNK